MSARFRDRLRQDQRFALFGDDPPPPRQHAPYPEGDLIYQCNKRFIVRHGDTVTKYTTHPDGLGRHNQPNEADAMRFVRKHTGIPVPEVISSDWDRITMQYVEGQTLQKAWPTLTPAQRSDILTQLGGYIAQMRAMQGLYIGRFNGEGALTPGVIPRSGGPFTNIEDFHDWLTHPPKRPEAMSMYWHQITTQLRADCPIVFTHGDIAARNILVREGCIVAILDWEMAGWYPEYWEYTFTLRGMDNVDWDSLGRHLKSLFSKTYDQEYILMSFILTLS